jgi:protein DJ-1
VTIAGISGPQPVKCSRNAIIVTDKALSDTDKEYDVVILPGGLSGAHAIAKVWFSVFWLIN